MADVSPPVAGVTNADGDAMSLLYLHHVVAFFLDVAQVWSAGGRVTPLGTIILIIMKPHITCFIRSRVSLVLSERMIIHMFLIVTRHIRLQLKEPRTR